MSDKLEILKMIESGKISVDEGLQMIEALEQTEKIEDEVRDELFSKKNEEENESKSDPYETESKEMKDFDVSLTTCKLNVERSNVDEVTIEIMNDKTRDYIEKPEWLHLIEEKNTITIKESRVTNLSDIFDFFKSGNLISNSIFVNVKIPLDLIVNKGRFSNVSGSISLIGLNGLDIEAKSVSGKVYVTDLKARTIQMKSTSGAVIADNIKVAKGYLKSISGKVKSSGESHYLECKTVSGSIEAVCSSILDVLVANSISGKIELHLAEPESYNLKLSTISGNIETNGFAIVNKSSSGKKSVNISNRSKTKQLSASTVSALVIIDKI